MFNFPAGKPSTQKKEKLFINTDMNLKIYEEMRVEGGGVGHEGMGVKRLGMKE